MAASAFMVVKNQGTTPVTLSVGNSNCMESGFDQFTGTIEPGGQMPANEPPMEIVVNGDGSCAFESSWFDIHVDPTGMFSISERDYSWSSDNVQGQIDVNIEGNSITVLIG